MTNHKTTNTERWKRSVHYLRKQHLLVFLLAFAMLVPVLAPVAKTAAAATNFTYAYQTGGKVESLNMTIGEKVDLKFIGVKDYKNYKLTWISTNEKVATVDKSGVITAVANGTTEVYLQVGSGTVYTSKRITVTVGAIVNVLLGTSKTNTFQFYPLPMGKTVDLNFYGVTDWATDKYSASWTSSVPSVATVDSRGVVTPRSTGTTVISLSIINRNTGVALNVIPVEVLVTSAGAATPTPTPTGKLTPTPAPTTSVTPTVTPSATPVPANNPYTMKQLSDTEIQLTFAYDVAYTSTDFTMTCLYLSNYELDVPIQDVSIKGNIVILKAGSSFNDGYKYTVHVGGATQGSTITAKIGAVDSLSVSYSSMGKSGVAYTNGDDGDVIDIKLETKLMSNGIDVSNLYDVDSVVYTLARENDYVYLDEYEGILNIDRAGIAVTVYATYTYYTNTGVAKELRGIVTVVSTKAPAYRITNVAAWTIVAPGDKKIDWNNPIHSVAVDDNEYHIVALIQDNYDNTFITDANFATAEYPAIQGSMAEDKGFEVEFSSSNYDKLLVGSDGSLVTYTATTVSALVIVYNFNYSYGSDDVRTIAALPITISAERKVSKLVFSESSLDLVVDGDYTTGTVELKVYDQYGAEWTKRDLNFDVKCTVEELSMLADLTYDASEKKAELTMDGKVIYSMANNKTSVTYTFTEPEYKKSTTLRVQLRKPRYDSNGEIKVTSNQLIAENIDQYADLDSSNGRLMAASNVVLYKMSNSYKVGSDNSYILVSKAADLKVKKDIANVGDQYLAIYAPDGSVVQISTGTKVGVTKTNDGCKVIVAYEDDSNCVQYLATGTYTAKLFEIASFNSSGYAVMKQKYADTFVVSNTAKLVAVKRQMATISEASTINDIIREAFAFTLGGVDWIPDDEYIKDVEVRKLSSASYVVITSITFRVPLNDPADGTYFEQKVIINKSIRTPEYS